MDLCCKGIEFLSFVQGSDRGSANLLNEGLRKKGDAETVNNGDPASQIATTVAIRNDRSMSTPAVSNAQIGGQPGERVNATPCRPFPRH
jgi:hypothetical protein